MSEVRAFHDSVKWLLAVALDA